MITSQFDLTSEKGRNPEVPEKTGERKKSECATVSERKK